MVYGLLCFGRADSLPEANKKVLEYVNTQIGKRVKSGQCFYLVEGALDFATPDWHKRLKRKWIFSSTYINVYGKRIGRKKLRAGDIISYEWKYRTGNWSKRNSHICIAYSIDEKGNIKIAEQNADGKYNDKN